MDYVEVDVEIVAVTDRSVLLGFQDECEEWIPLSQIEDNGERLRQGAQMTLYIRQWILEERGIDIV